MYTFKFAEFEGKNIPPYAVASHRWCDDEATYVDVLENKNTESSGFEKVKGFCEFTKWRNEEFGKGRAVKGACPKIEWMWIDTCCIDRRSSAEIAENITSMYRYYERSEECYAYLPDVIPINDTVDLTGVHLSQFMNSSWFTRGWTLQELLAPTRVFFLSSDWRVFGHKCSGCQASKPRQVPWHRQDIACAWGQNALNYTISRVTDISVEVLSRRLDPRTMRPDEICKWIENRETKKEEDLAYCLLGLFRVFLVPNYGEGENAWSRLEEEVSKKRKRTISLPRPNQLRPEDHRRLAPISTIHSRAVPFLEPIPNVPRQIDEHESDTGQLASEARRKDRREGRARRNLELDWEQLDREQRREFDDRLRNRTGLEQTDLEQMAQDRRKYYEQRIQGEVADQERLLRGEQERRDCERMELGRMELEQMRKERGASRFFTAEERERKAQERRCPYPLELEPRDQEEVDLRLTHNGRSRRHSVQEADTESQGVITPIAPPPAAGELSHSRHHKHGGSTRDRTIVYIHLPSPKKPVQMSDPELSRPRTLVMEDRPRTTHRRSTSRPTIIHQGVSDSEWRDENSPQKSGLWNTLTGGIMS